MIIRDAALDVVCGVKSALPAGEMPQIAFAGKSNVGKSSLINRLLGRKSLARTSSQPGKTQTINFYAVNKAFHIVDLPGYGYARASMKERMAWASMIERYLHNAKQLRVVFALVDIRHEPGENDKTMIRWVRESGYRPVIIATKLDKIKRSQTAKQISLIRRALEADDETIVIPFSAQTGQGKEEIWDLIEKILGGANE